MRTLGGTRCDLACLVGLLALALTWSADPVIAQPVPGPFPTPTPIGGVYVDAQGTVKARQVVSQGRFSAVRRRPIGQVEEKDLCYISLPRLFAQVKTQLDAKQPVGDDLRFLNGMTKLRYVFVFPDDNDLVIAGECEPIPARHNGRPIGKKSGRPMLRLDDLVTALRTVGPGKRARAFGCSIDLTNAQLNNMATEARKWGAIRSSQRRAMADALAKAVGPQAVRFIGVEPNTMFAYVCVEADYLLKRVSLGLTPPPTPKVPSALSMATSGEGMYHRFWFEPKYEPLLVSEDGNAYALRGQALQVKATGTIDRNAPKAGPSAQRFAKAFTDNFETIAAKHPIFADLWNVTDLAMLAALIEQDGLHKKVGWNVDWLLESSGYPVATVIVPRQADALVNYHKRSGRVGFGVGGVMLSPYREIVPEKREQDKAGKLQKAARRPGTDGWVTKQQ